MGNGCQYNPEQLAFIKANIPLYAWEELTSKFNERFGTNLTFKALRQAANRRKIYRPPETQHFQKGCKPWNAFSAGKGIMKPNRTSFQKGHDLNKKSPLGAERKDSKHGLVIVKISDVGKPCERWKFRAALVLEKAGIAIPKGYVAFHKNGIPDDDRLENLEVIPRAVLARIGHCVITYGKPYKDLPPELQETVLLKAKLQVKLKSLRRPKNK